MANYLERVAFSAARKAAVAKPPSSGPPVMPAGRDFIPSGQETFAAEEDELFGTSALDKKDKSKQSAESDATSDIAPAVEPEPRPRPATTPVSLKNDTPFTVHLPKTLRPVTPEKVLPSVPETPISDRVAPAEPPRVIERSDQEPIAVVRTVETEVREEQSITDKSPVTLVRSESDVEPIVKEIYKETVAPEPPLIAPRVREVIRNKIISTTIDGESLTVAQPRQAPAVVVSSSAPRPEPSRISVGQFEVLVNNQPPPAPARPVAAAPVQSNNMHLERRYLDRFRLRR